MSLYIGGLQTTVKDGDDGQAPKRRKDNETSSSTPKITPQEIASSMTEVGLLGAPY